MKFVKLLKYVERSFEGKPSFLILMSDGKEYISNGCVFVENTKDNREALVDEYGCEGYLTELLENGLELDISEITNSSFMFYGCTSLVSFDADMSRVTDSYSMFYGCTSLVSFDTDMSKVTDSRYMFYDCTSLTNNPLEGE